MKVAFAGNPNSGKTTMYNAFTGKSEKVGNWAGVTVDKKEGTVKKRFCIENEAVVAVDLPGAYSMSPFTNEESVTKSYIQNENPDVIVNIVDATNLSRSLFFTPQLLELGIPTVIALNKSDINKKKDTKINSTLLSEKLGCPVVETVSTNAAGLKEVMLSVYKVKGKGQTAPYSDENINPDDKETAKQADKKRYDFVKEIVSKVEKRKVFTNQKNIHDKIDSVLTNKWIGIPIFAFVMFFVFQISQAWLGDFIANGAEGTAFKGLVGYIGDFKETVAGWMAGASDILQAVVLEGMIEGVAAVVGFLPLVMVMYFLIALLEDCGYMSRVSVILDPIFKRVGLSGKSVIPFVIGTGCAIPGVMACRTIRDERERRATAILAPFMPCGAKLPMISLFVGAFFPKSGWVGTSMYFAGIIIIFFCALVINKITGYKGRKSYFIIELPEYKFPSFARAFKSMCSRGWSYIVKAGTVILVCNFVIYLMQNFTWSFSATENPNDSILADVAAPFAYIFAPIVGIVAWKFAAAAITGFIAKECVVSTLATCYMFGHIMDGEGLAVSENFSGTDIVGFMPITSVAALAFLMFNLFTPPCFAAIGAMNSEIANKKWLLGGVLLQFGVGYTIGFLVFFFGTLFTVGRFEKIWMPILGWALVAAFVLAIALLIINSEKRLKAEAIAKKAL